MGRPFIRQLPCKKGERFYGCRFCRTQIASAPTISVEENGTISRGTIPDFLNLYTPNSPKKWGLQIIQEFSCTHCNRRLGWKSIKVKNKQGGVEIIYGGAMQLQPGIHSVVESPPSIDIIRDDEPVHGNIAIFDDPNMPQYSNNKYICRNCDNQIAVADNLMDNNPHFSPGDSGLTGGLFAHVFSENLQVRDDSRRDVGRYTTKDVHCNQCHDHLGWQFVQDRPLDRARRYILISGDYLFMMHKLTILRVDDDAPAPQNPGQGGQ